jgi:hypothetical protein
MFWPQPTDYNDAVQSPGDCFTDEELRLGEVAADPFGLPMPYAGNFANVYQVRCPNGQVYAVKCFTRPVTDLQQRYYAISSHLREAGRPFQVEFHYLADGIQVSGSSFPVLKMRWVEGFTLNSFLTEHVGNKSAVGRLCRLWVKLAVELREARMGHGDLQHGNVMLVDGRKANSLSLRLIDYDGMWVPALDGNPPGENGHPNYQHPDRLRDGSWSSEVDRFSHLVIYTALRACVGGGRALWERYDNSENLLFRAADFTDPIHSPLIQEIWGARDLALLNMVGHLVLALFGSLDAVPFLGDVVTRDGDVTPLTASQRDSLHRLLGPGGWDRAEAMEPPGMKSTILPIVNVGEGAAPAPEWLTGAAEPEKPRRKSRADIAIPVVPDPSVPFYPVPEIVPMPVPEVPPLVAVLVEESDPRWQSAPTALPVESDPTIPVLEVIPLEDTTVTPAPVLREKYTTRYQAPEPTGATRPDRTVLLGLSLVIGLPTLFAMAVVLGVFLYRYLFPPRPPRLPEPAQLPLIENISFKAGKQITLPLEIDRHDEEGDLEVRIEGLPDRVNGIATAIAPHETKTFVTLRAAADCPGLQKTIQVSLMHGNRALHTQRATLSIVAFLRPVPHPVDPVVLHAGERQLVRVSVDRKGNADPLTLKFEDLPPGVSQVEAGPEVARNNNEAIAYLQADATAQPGANIARVTVLADGIRGGDRLVNVSVQPAPTGRVLITPPSEVKLVATEPQTLSVEFSREGVPGELEFRVLDLPGNVTCAPVSGMFAGGVARLELRSIIPPPVIRVSRARLTVSSFGTTVGETALDIRVSPAGAVASPEPVVKPPVPVVVMPPARGEKILTADGVILGATYYEPPPKSRGFAILMLHDWGEDRTEETWDHLARALQERGHAVLKIDFRGHGDSTRVADWPVFAKYAGRNGGAKGWNSRTAVALDRTVFPAAYRAQLVQDVVAARLWLDLYHDKGDLNSSNLVVIGAGEGATVGSLWLASEFRRYKAGDSGEAKRNPATSEGRDVAAAIWLGSKFASIPRPGGHYPWLHDAGRVPTAFIVGEDESKATAEGFVERLRRDGVSQAEVRVILGGTGGQGLLRSARAETEVLDFLAGVQKRHEYRERAVRNVKFTAYHWAFSSVPSVVLAKMPNSEVAQPLPVDRVR